MGNSFFKYKQFIVNQGDCAMKVCTDTSLFGAIIKPNSPKSILDIGTGTGVLSLMVAQKTGGKITAIEIDEKAANQASDNFTNSKWKDRIILLNDDVKIFTETNKSKFDLIISNPPFFQGNKLSEVTAKNLARHDTSLTLKKLAECVNNLMATEGQFWVLLPQYEASIFEDLMKNFGFNISYQINVKNYLEDVNISRTINCFEKKDQVNQSTTIAIYKDKNREYTDEFVNYLKPYYLYL